MTRGQRFGLWIVVIAACMSAPIWIAWAGMTRGALLAATIHSLIAMSAMIHLMLTTPRDAIRLAWWLSGVCISIGMLWLLWCAGGTGLIRYHLVQVNLGISAIWIIACWTRTTQSRGPSGPASYTPWLACILLWSPPSWIGLVADPTDNTKVSVMMLLSFGLLLICMVAVAARSRSGAWAAWALHAMLILAWVWWEVV